MAQIVIIGKHALAQRRHRRRDDGFVKPGAAAESIVANAGDRQPTQFSRDFQGKWILRVLIINVGHNRDAGTARIDHIAEVAFQLRKLNLIDICRPAGRPARKAPTDLEVALRNDNRALDPGLRIVRAGSKLLRRNWAVFLEAMPDSASRIVLTKDEIDAFPIRINPEREQSRAGDLCQQLCNPGWVVLRAANIDQHRIATDLELIGADAPVFRVFHGEVQGMIVKGVSILVPAQIRLGHRAGAVLVHAIDKADGVGAECCVHGQAVCPLRNARSKETAAALARRQNRLDESCAVVFRMLDQQFVTLQRLLQRERHHDTVEESRPACRRGHRWQRERLADEGFGLIAAEPPFAVQNSRPGGLVISLIDDPGLVKELWNAGHPLFPNHWRSSHEKHD